MAFIMTDIPNQHTVDLDGTSLSAHEKLQFLKERHPNSCRIFYESLNQTLSTLLYDVESVSLQENLIRYLEEGTQGTNAESQAETPSYVIETVSFLSIWCTVKGELLSFGDAMTNTMIQQAIHPRARQSSAYRIALMSKSDESYLFNTSLVISTVIQAETNALNHLVSDFPIIQKPEETKSSFPESNESLARKMWNKLNTPQFKRTLILLITLGLIAYAMVFVQMWSDDKTLQIAKGASIIPLNDTVYDNLIPNSFKTLPDTIADVPIAVSLVSVILFSLWTHWKRDPLRALRRSLFVLNLLYFGRMVSLSTTRVPPSNPEYCRPFPAGSQVFLTSLNTLTSNLRSCSDMMYSGHTSILSTFAIRLAFDAQSLSILPRILVRIVMACVYLFAITIFVAVRLHYSMDVWVAILLGLSWAIGFEVLFDMLPYFHNGNIATRVLNWIECL